MHSAAHNAVVQGHDAFLEHNALKILEASLKKQYHDVVALNDF